MIAAIEIKQPIYKQRKLVLQTLSKRGCSGRGDDWVFNSSNDQSQRRSGEHGFNWLAESVDCFTWPLRPTGIDRLVGLKGKQTKIVVLLSESACWTWFQKYQVCFLLWENLKKKIMLLLSLCTYCFQRGSAGTSFKCRHRGMSAGQRDSS